jgi:uncharacterized protein YggT (Ycf19 family)
MLFVRFVEVLCNILIVAIFARAILSWFTNNPKLIISALNQITEPILACGASCRGMGMLTSPLVAIIILAAIQSFVAPAR